MHPAMVASFVTGGILMWDFGADALTMGWLHGKLACLAGLVVMHGLMAKWRMEFAEDRNRHSERYYRVMNEVPTVLMIAIVILAVVKPF